MHVVMQRKRWIGVAAVVVAIAGMALWSFVGSSREAPDFRRALENGNVQNMPAPIRDMTWTPADFDTLHVRWVPGHRRFHALATFMPSRDPLELSGRNYNYQACITNNETGIRYVFGRSRADFAAWVWTGIHPDSMERHIQLRAEEVERIKANGGVP